MGLRNPTNAGGISPLSVSYETTVDALQKQTFELWEEETQKEALQTKDSRGLTPTHWAGREGYLHLIPQALMTESLLLQGLPHTDSPLHVAARCGHIAQIPAWLLNEHLLLTKNTEGLTALFITGITGHLDQIPPSLLTKKTLLKTLGGEHSSTTLHAIATIGDLNKLPKHLLTPDILLLPNSDGHTPLELACLYQPKKALRGLLRWSTLIALQKNPKTPPHCLEWVTSEIMRIKPLLSSLIKQDHTDL